MSPLRKFFTFHKDTKTQKFTKDHRADILTFVTPWCFCGLVGFFVILLLGVDSRLICKIDESHVGYL
jgi:hypothetical protein